MLLDIAINEFRIESESRKFTRKTIRSYRNNLNIFLRFRQEREQTNSLDDVSPAVISSLSFLL